MAATNLLSAVSSSAQLSLQLSFGQNFFAKRKEVTLKELILYIIVLVATLSLVQVISLSEIRLKCMEIIRETHNHSRALTCH